MKEVIKKWGKEVWVVNEPEYCCKFLHIDKGMYSSYHYHTDKKGTFLVTDGNITLMVDDVEYKLHARSEPFTIEAGIPHKFWSVTGAVVLETSMHHDENDVVRLSESGRME